MSRARTLTVIRILVRYQNEPLAVGCIGNRVRRIDKGLRIDLLGEGEGLVGHGVALLVQTYLKEIVRIQPTCWETA
ncbi:hypothetical protein Neosp_007707 [[Neocosmospora] mangrovei]